MIGGEILTSNSTKMPKSANKGYKELDHKHPRTDTETANNGLDVENETPTESLNRQEQNDFIIVAPSNEQESHDAHSDESINIQDGIIDEQETVTHPSLPSRILALAIKHWFLIGLALVIVLVVV